MISRQAEDEMPRSQSNNGRVEFHKHPPERRGGKGAKLYCGGGCCCCSCCLHSLGGLIGAALASPRRQAGPGSANAGIYWLTLLLVTGLSVLLFAVFNVSSGGIVLFLLFLPV